MIIKTDQNEIQNFLADASNFKGNCDAVYFPENAEEIQAILIEANKNKTPVTVAGNGTGLTGARVPKGGIVISTERLNQIIEINNEGKFAVLQAAVILDDFQKILREKNLFYPADPTEGNSFIGANVATNASGAKTFKYGPTRGYVLGIKLILPNGELLNLERGNVFAEDYKLELITESENKIEITIPDYVMPETKHAAGYFCKKNMDAIDLFIGSEGTLGIIYEIKLKLLNFPEAILSSVIFFKTEYDALKFVEEARQLSRNNKSEIDALALEYFDNFSLKFMSEDYPQIPAEAKAAVWFEQEYNSENENIIFENWMNLINKFGGDEESAWFAATDKDREKFKDFRHAVAWKVTEYIAQHNVTKVGTDTSVPDEHFINFYNESISIVKSNNLDYIIYGHAGNCHLHLNMLPKTQEELLKARNIHAQLCELAVKLKGTISAEHGIGKSKKDYLLKMYGEENIIKMAALKSALDPNKILGLGTMFNESYLN